MAWKIGCHKVRIISEDNKKVPVLYYLLRKLSNRFVVQHTSGPLNTDPFLCKSISTLIITLAYQYASCSSGVLVRKVIQVALYSGMLVRQSNYIYIPVRWWLGDGTFQAAY